MRTEWAVTLEARWIARARRWDSVWVEGWGRGGHNMWYALFWLARGWLFAVDCGGVAGGGSGRGAVPSRHSADSVEPLFSLPWARRGLARVGAAAGYPRGAVRRRRQRFAGRDARPARRERVVAADLGR